MAAVDWGLIGTWAGVAFGAVGAVAAAWGVVHARRADARAHAADARADEATLSTRAWSLQGSLFPVAAIGAARTSRAPIEVWVDGANVWVHEVRLSWGFALPQPALIATDALCVPRGNEQLPVQLFATSGRPLGLDWPGDMPAEQRSLTYQLRARYSVARDGRTFWREVAVANVTWMEQ